jgi:hypothetical protein
MRKSLSLMLSAALTFGSVLSSYAAPLKKATGLRSAKGEVAEMVKPLPAQKTINTSFAKVKTAAATPNVKGIYNGNVTLKQNKQNLRRATTGRRISADVQVVGGFAYTGDNEDLGYNLYNIPTATGQDFELYGPIDMTIYSGFEDSANGYYYCTYVYTFWGMIFGIYVYQFDLDTWEVVSSTSVDTGMLALELCQDPTTGDVYGCYYSDDGADLVWGKGDYEEGTREAIATLNVQLMGIGCSKAGQFYGLGADKTLYKIDKETGDLEAIATDIDINSYYLASGCYNDKDNTFLATYCAQTGESGIVEINIETGEVIADNPFQYGEEVVSLYIPRPACDDKAPAAVEFAATCEGGSMDVNLSVTLPTTLFDGTEVPNDAFSFSVVDENDNVIFEGSGPAGTTVTKTYTYETDGIHTLKAYASNGVGDGPKSKVSVYVGKGTPANPTNATLAWADGTATVTWNAVTTSSDGGYLDPEAVTYTVYNNKGEAVSENQVATSFTEVVPEPESGYNYLKYTVQANYEAKSSKAVATNAIGLGAYTAPVNFNFTSAEGSDYFTQHTVIDGNGDGRTWALDSYGARYTYSSSNEGDDWLISPAVQLEGGKAYVYTVTARCQGTSFPERLEVFCGTAATDEAMTEEVLPATDIKTTAMTDYQAVFIPQTSGKYYFGIHAISDADQYYLRVQGQSIGAAMETTAPAAVENLVATPKIDGSLMATVTFTNPSKDVAGNDLTGSVSGKVYIGDSEDPYVTVVGAAGAEMTASVSVAERGTYTIKVVPENANGEEGLASTTSAYFGPKTPSPAANRNGYETETAGTIVLVWDPVTTATDGTEILASNITYNVYSVVEEDGSLYVGEQLNSAPLTDCTFTVVGEAYDTQDFVQYVVQSNNLDVAGGYYLTNPIAVGPAYSVPALMSADDESLDAYPVAVATSDSYSTLYVKDDSFIQSADEDNASFAAYGGAVGSVVSMFTGKFNLTGLDNPIVKFYNYKIAEADNNILTVYALANGVMTELETIDREDVENVPGWNEYKVDLSAYKNQTIQLVFAAQTVMYYYTIFDAINICDDLAYDLSAKIAAPSKVNADETFEVVVTVKNEGSQDSGEYTVDLLRDGEIVATQKSPILAASEKETFEFEQTIGRDAEAAEFKAVVSYEADLNLDNNETATVKVARKLSSLPQVDDLAGDATAEGNVLTWSPIVIDENTPGEYTEDFESAEPWAQDEFEGWTFVDNDGAAIGGFNGITLPGITSGTTTNAYFVMDGSDSCFEGYEEAFAANSGDLYLASMFNYDGSQNDDWAISPVLPGIAQTVSFYAKSYSADYLEEVEVWYSTTDTELDSFTRCEDLGKAEVPNAWTQFSADLPEGAKYFAIRHCSADKFLLFIDDVTYETLGAFKGKLEGYNVYRDGVKINEALVTDATYTDATADGQAHTYAVTAVYDLGESEFSNLVTIEASGVVTVKGETLSITTEGKYIVVKGAGELNVTINAVDGKTLYSAAGDARVEATSAVYLVTVGNKTVKVIVR